MSNIVCYKGLLMDGSTSDLSMTFNAEQNTGWYRDPGNVKFLIAGSQITNTNSTGLSVTGTLTATNISSTGSLITARANVASAAAINSLSSTTSFVKLTGSTATTLNGIGAGNNGQRLVVANMTGQTLTISNNSASGASGEKITTMTGADITTTGNGAAEFIYDTDASPAVWLCIWTTA